MGTFKYSDFAKKKFEKSQQKLQALYKGTGYKGTDSDPTMWDEKTGLYLPVSVEYHEGISNTTTNSPSFQDSWSPWRLGVCCMVSDLGKAGFWSMRLAEQMYLASRVFDHNLATRASQHKMRAR